MAEKSSSAAVILVTMGESITKAANSEIGAGADLTVYPTFQIPTDINDVSYTTEGG